MGVQHYMIDRGRREAYELGKSYGVKTPADAALYLWRQGWTRAAEEAERFAARGHVEIVSDSLTLPWDDERGWSLVGSIYCNKPTTFPRPLPDHDPEDTDDPT